MYRRVSGKSGCFVFIVIMAITALLNSMFVPYTVNQFGAVFDKPEMINKVQPWQGAVVGFVPYVGQAIFPVTVVTWLVFDVIDIDGRSPEDYDQSVKPTAEAVPTGEPIPLAAILQEPLHRSKES